MNESKDILYLRLYPDPALRIKCKPFPSDIELRKDVAEQMFQIMCDNNGLGLSATQVGLDVSVFVMNSLDNPAASTCYFNPIIVGHSPGTKDGEEGCLSLLGRRCKVKRFISIEVQFEAIDGTKYHKSLEDIDARCAQHELDHLNGIMIFDHINSNLSRKLFLEKYFKELKKHNRR